MNQLENRKTFKVMKQTESKHKHTAAERAGEFKTRLALLRRAALLCLGLCAALICAALPVAAQSLSVDHNIAYVGEDLTFTYIPASSDCPPDPEAATVYRDLTIYVGSVTQFDIPMSMNSDGTFTGIYKTTTNDVGNDNWVEVYDDCNNTYEPIELEFAVLQFGYFILYDANRIDPANVAAVKHPGGSVEVDAMSFPPNWYASTLYDWNLSSDCISWRQDNWGGYASRNVPYDYYFSVTLDGVYWNWLDVWVVWASVTEFKTAGPKNSDCKISNDVIKSGSDSVWGAVLHDYGRFFNGALVQWTILPTGFATFTNVFYDIKQTKESQLWINNSGTWQKNGSHEGPEDPDIFQSSSLDLIPSSTPHIYSWDAPGFQLSWLDGPIGFVYSGSFVDRAYVAFPSLTGMTIFSDDYQWHSISWATWNGTSYDRNPASGSNDVNPGSNPVGNSSTPP